MTATVRRALLESVMTAFREARPWLGETPEEAAGRAAVEQATVQFAIALYEALPCTSSLWQDCEAFRDEPGREFGVDRWCSRCRKLAGWREMWSAAADV